MIKSLKINKIENAKVEELKLNSRLQMDNLSIPAILSQFPHWH